MAKDPKIFIIVANWNGWKDTIECLESVFRISYSNYQVIVRDNYSDDGSLEHIKAWADGRQACVVSDENPLKGFSYPPVPKPIPCRELSRAEAEQGGLPDDARLPLLLIQNGANLGFAGGNNVALRFALARNDFDYVWLLNNDTVIKHDALDHLVARMRESPQAGLCGSTLIYYHAPDKLQAMGGARYNYWLAKSTHIGMFRSPSEPIDRDAVEHLTDYIVGASMLASRRFLLDIGLMSEDYFLYCEEIDWALRSKGRYSMVYSPESIVYHKEGAIIGASYLRPKEKSATSEYYAVRSRLLFTKKYYHQCLPTVYCVVLARMAIHMVRGKWDRVKLIWDILIANEGR